MKLRKVLARAVASHFPGRNCYCPVCERQVHRFLPYQHPRAVLMTALDCIGSDTNNFSCPRCGAHDRERHLLLYLRATGLLGDIAGKDLLHFAPEARACRWLVSATPRRYVKCDLFPSSPEIEKVDILDMPFDDASFDIIIANHILEHVSDDRLATTEIVRVLRPGGWAILQTPYSSMLKYTWEDPGITGEAARLQAFGQEDHVRLFGTDIFERIASSGLIAEIYTHEQLLPEIDAIRVGVNRLEPFFLFRKPNHPPTVKT